MRIFLNFVLICLAGCAHKEGQRPIEQINFYKFDSISIGMKDEQVKKIAPHFKTIAGKDSASPTNWIYYDTLNSFQIATLAFSNDTHILLYKKINIVEAESPESKLNYLLEKKYSGVKFKIAKYPYCEHFLNPQVKYYNIESGVIIEYRSQDQNVESITTTTPEITKKIIETSQNCPKN